MLFIATGLHNTLGVCQVATDTKVCLEGEGFIFEDGIEYFLHRIVCYNHSMLDEKTISEIKKIVFYFLDPREYKVFIFGSRATGEERKFSDIDIGIKGQKKMSDALVEEIKEKFEESSLPYTVDVVNFSQVSDRFKEVSMQKVIYLN